jgi:hypothetical protein
VRLKLAGRRFAPKEQKSGKSNAQKARNSFLNTQREGLKRFAARPRRDDRSHR